MTLGDLLKNYREDNKISMDEFSKRSTLSKGYISMLENNINPRNNKPIAPTLPTIQKIALGMGTDVDSILKALDDTQAISLEDDNGNKFNICIGKRIKEARLKCGLTQEQLANMVGVAKSTITGYEVGNREPTAAKVGEIADALNVDANFLYQDEVKMFYENRATSDEMEHIKKYRLISEKDTDGKILVDSTIDYLCKKIQEKDSLLKEIQNQKTIYAIETTTAPTRFITYYQKLASAGTGEYLFDSVPTDTMQVSLNKVSEEADFVIGVNGRSMEPTYYDGDKVYVKITDEIPIGCIGLFTQGNDCFIKELGMNCLKSHNHADGYEDIPASEDIKLVGEVLGKIEDD